MTVKINLFYLTTFEMFEFLPIKKKTYSMFGSGKQIVRDLLGDLFKSSESE